MCEYEWVLSNEDGSILVRSDAEHTISVIFDNQGDDILYLETEEAILLRDMLTEMLMYIGEE